MLLFPVVTYVTCVWVYGARGWRGREGEWIIELRKCSAHVSTAEVQKGRMEDNVQWARPVIKWICVLFFRGGGGGGHHYTWHYPPSSSECAAAIKDPSLLRRSLALSLEFVRGCCRMVFFLPSKVHAQTHTDFTCVSFRFSVVLSLIIEEQ